MCDLHVVVAVVVLESNKIWDKLKGEILDAVYTSERRLSALPTFTGQLVMNNHWSLFQP